MGPRREGDRRDGELEAGADGKQAFPDAPEEFLTRQAWGLRIECHPMKTLLVIAASAALAGCGLETATTAATAASIKKQELQQGQRTMQQAQQKIDAAMQQVQQRAGSDPEQ